MSTFIPVEAVQYQGTVNEGKNGWCAYLHYGDVLALCVPARKSAWEAKVDCLEYAKQFGWKIEWKEGK